MSDDKGLIFLVKLKSGLELITRADKDEDKDVIVLNKPITFVQTQQGLAPDVWPSFAAEDAVIVLKDEDVMCVTTPHENVQKVYKQFHGEITIETPPEKKLVLPT
jgi:hypothetical protein